MDHKSSSLIFKGIEMISLDNDLIGVGLIQNDNLVYANQGLAEILDCSIEDILNEEGIIISIGITKEDKDKLFRQFGKIERYGKGWDIGIEGPGFGLYNSKKLVELHGGRMWAESEGKNKGRTFYFSIPLI